MTLQADGFFDWAWRLECDYKTLLRDGGKLIEARPSAMEGICGHSLEGGLSIPDGIRTLLGKGPSGCTSAERRDVMAALERAYWAWRDPLRASTAWQGTNVWGVRAMIQHAPWHSRLAHGNAFNVRGPGLEHEGRAPTPIDDNQVATSLRVTRDTEAAYGRKFPWTEHRKWGPTACPSERLAPLHAALAKGGSEVTREEIEALKKDIAETKKSIAELERRTGANPPNEQRARNADLLLYADGLNTAVHKNIDALKALQLQVVALQNMGTIPFDHYAPVADALESAVQELRGIASHVDG